MKRLVIKMSIGINSTYLCNNTNYRKNRTSDIRYIVIHYVGATGSALNNVKYYSTTPNIGASSHYFVGHASENGEIYQSVPDECCAWHCGTKGNYYHACRNDSAIGIEMCCHKDKNGNWYFDDITVKKTIELTKELMAKYSIPVENVIRHYDVTHKTCPAPFVNDISAWNKFKEALCSKSELETINDIVWELSHRGIISNKELWIKKLSEDTNVYWLARKAANYIRKL